MNKSYSKLRHTNNINYLLEQRYLSEKRNRDFGILSEQNSTASLIDSTLDWVAGVNYGNFESCTKNLGRVGDAKIRFDGNYYYFSDGKYTSKLNFEQYKKDVQGNPETEMKYSGTYSCKETKDITTNQTKSIIKRVEDTSGLSNPFANFDYSSALDTRGPIERMALPSTETSTTQPTETSTTQPTTNQNTQTQQVSGMGYVFPNVFTPNVVNDLRSKIGSSEKSGTLTQTDINLLYDKISKM